MTITTIMAAYTAGSGLMLIGITVEHVKQGNNFMAILGVIALYGIIETLVKYYYIRKEVMAEVEAKNVNKDGKNVDKQ